MQEQTSQTQTSSNAFDSSDLMERPDIAKLNSYYLDADSCDQEIFAEMRSNILLAAGDHYNKRQSKFFKRLRDSKSINDEQKIRLTKNHIQKICKTYSNNILSPNPGVGFTPKDESSMHDQKVTDLHHSVWIDAVNRYHIHEKMDDWVDNFIQIGEVALKVFFDPFLGNVKGYENSFDEETGEIIVDENGMPVPDQTKPMLEGEFVFEEIYGFNLLRPPECKDMRKAEWLGLRKMVDRAELLRKFKNNDELKKYVNSDSDETYTIFDPLGGGYKQSTKQTMIREYYYRPSLLFPQGYFYITTKAGILAEGDLPGGRFPIVFAAYDKVQTSPRGRSPIKFMRPYQAEINRAASKIAEHQITLGDDKLLIQNGTKVSAGVSLPGVRSVNYTGSAPQVLQGRDGSQYSGYATNQISELYMVANVQEDSVENQGQMDPYVMLYKSGSQKKKFQRYIRRFENFLIEVVKLYLDLAKIHLPDDAVVWAVGKNEQVNIAEFRALSDTCYEINVEAQSDDIETKLGKQLVLNHALQYVGPQLKPDEIGKLLRQMPFANFDESFDDLTIDYDSVQNDMLALDRGEKPPVNQYDDHKYAIKKLTGRSKKADFKFLDPSIQQNYSEKIQLHQQMEAANQLAIQRAEQGFIPTGGALIAVDFYVEAPNSSGGMKTQRVRLPYQAIDWLTKQLDAQGAGQANIDEWSSGAQAQLANQVSAGSQQPQPGQAGAPTPMQQPRMALAGQ